MKLKNGRNAINLKQKEENNTVKFDGYSSFVSKELEGKLLLYEGNIWSALMRVCNERVVERTTHTRK